MMRIIFIAAIAAVSCMAAAADELKVNAGSEDALLCRALDDLVRTKAAEPAISQYVRDGSSVIPRNPGRFFKQTPSFAYDMAEGELVVKGNAVFGDVICPLVYREKVQISSAVQELDGRSDMTGFRDRPAFRDLMLEELTSYKGAYFFSGGTAAVRKGEVIVTLVPLETLPSFVPKSASAPRGVKRTANLKGKDASFARDAESGFDAACARYGIPSGEEGDFTVMMGPADCQRRQHLGMQVPSVSGKIGVAAGSMLIASAEVTGKSSAMIDEQAAKAAAYSLWGGRCAEYAVRAVIRSSYRLDPSGKKPAKPEPSAAPPALLERDVQVTCRIKAGEKSRNPYLPEFEAAFLSVFAGSKGGNPPCSAVIELAPVYDQGQVGQGFVSKRAYCIIWVFRGKERIFSDNVSDAAVALSGEAAGKEASIKTAKKAAARLRDFIAGIRK